MLLEQVINEISQLRSVPNRRSAIEIHRLLDANKQVFGEHMDPASFSIILSDFQRLADAHAQEYLSEGYQRDYKKAFNLLMFYLDKIF